MRVSNGKAAVLLAAVFMLAGQAHAATGTWTLEQDGNWSDTTKWDGSYVPNAVDDVARFSVVPTTPRTVTLTSGVTLGSLVMTGLGTGSTPAPRYIIDLNSQTLTLNASTAFAEPGVVAATIYNASTSTDGNYRVNAEINNGTISLADPLRIYTGANGRQDTVISAVIQGASNLPVTVLGNNRLCVTNLQGANTFSGELRLYSGATRLSGTAGSVTSASAIRVMAPLEFVNVAANGVPAGELTNRTGSAPIIMQGGYLALKGDADGTAATIGGTVTSNGIGSHIIMSQNGGLNTLTIDSLARQNGGTFFFRAHQGVLGGTGNDGQVKLAGGSPTLDDDIIGAWALAGQPGSSGANNGFATYGANGIVPVTATANAAESSWVSAMNLRSDAAGTTTLSDNRALNTLNLGSGVDIDLNSLTLNVDAGGIFKQGAGGASTIRNGTVTVGSTSAPREMIITTGGEGATSFSSTFAYVGRQLNIGATLANNAAGGVVSLTKAGPGTLRFDTVPSFTGDLKITGGLVQFASGLSYTTPANDNMVIGGNGQLQLQGAGTLLTLGGNIETIATGSGVFDAPGQGNVNYINSPGGISLGGSNRTITVGAAANGTIRGDAASGLWDARIDGPITQTSGEKLIKTGEGALLLGGTLTNSTATVEVDQGTLWPISATPAAMAINLGSVGGANNATLKSTGSTIASPITVNTGTGQRRLINYGAANATNTCGAVIVSGAVTLNKDLQVDTTGNTVTFSGQVTGDGGIIKSGANLVTFSGAGTNLGGLEIQTGNVVMAAGIGASKMSGGLVIAGATDAWTAQLDLGDNGIAVAGLTYDDAQNMVINGLNDFGWNGQGIISSLAPAAEITAVGVVDNADLGYGDWMGLSELDSSYVLIRYTLYGDVDLNGTVDPDDLSSFADAYGITEGAKWVQGDVDYDGDVNPDDLSAFADNYGLSMGSASDVGFATVPEPATLCVLGLGAMALLRRRRSA